VFSLRLEAQPNCMYKPVQQKVSFLSPSVERDCSAHSCSLSGQPFRSPFNVPGDSVHVVDSAQIYSRNLFLKRLPSQSLLSTPTPGFHLFQSEAEDTKDHKSQGSNGQ